MTPSGLPGLGGARPPRRRWPAAGPALRVLGALARRVGVAVLVAPLGVLADALARRSFERVDIAGHVVAALSLHAAAGALLGLTCAAAVALAAAPARLLRARPGAAAVVQAALFAAIAALALAEPAFWAFSGRVARRGLVGAAGPYVVLAAIAAAAFLAARVVQRAFGAVERGRARGPAVAAAGLAAAAAGLAAADLTVLVALYTRVHAAVELAAALLLVCAGAVLSALAGRRAPRARDAVTGAAAGIGLACLAAAASTDVRAWHAERLRHVERDPVYVGRMLRRERAAADRLLEGVPAGELRAHRVDALLDRYDVITPARDARWDVPPAEPRALRQGIRALREGADDYNVLIYYVDTLRRDVAYDEGAMPSVARFADGAIRFDRAYSSGSDTMRALPALLSGRYDTDALSDDPPAPGAGPPPAPRPPPPGDLLDVARGRGLRPTLFIAQSASEFLRAMVPRFAFDDVNSFPDYARAGVWGYGADGTTARVIVDHALEWLSRRGSERFFIWLFNFDVHNWRELSKEHVYGAAEALGVPDEGPWNWRYRVAARTVDAQFGRLLEGLEELGFADNTVVLFVSDHGEALGRQGFWVHGVFLWEELIRVPLLLRVPGVPPAVVGDRVSIVDVAPTLARFLDPDVPIAPYHGEDLMGALVPGRPRRRLPILATSVGEGRVSRVGLIDGPRKLVLPLAWCEPQLLDLTARDPEDHDIAELEPGRTARLMSELLSSPVFMNAYREIQRKRATAP